MKPSIPDGHRASSSYSWAEGWFWLAFIASTITVLVNAIFGQFALFILRTDDPLLAIPTGAGGEVVTALVLFLLIGLLTELLRKLLRLPLSFHLGLQAGIIICLFQYAARTLLEVACREELYQGIDVPALGGYERWFLLVPFSLALVIIGWVSWRRRNAGDQQMGKDGMRLLFLMMVLIAAYVLTFNIWRESDSIRWPPVLAGILVLSGGGTLLYRISRKRGWGPGLIGRWSGGLSLSAVVALTIFYSWPSSDRRPNIIISLWDTARASRMSLFGYGESTTPNLESLSSRGVVFEAAYSTSNYTYPSHATIFLGETSREHNYHIGDLNEVRRYRQEHTLADLLRQKGYQTALFTENPWVIDLGKGFETVWHFPMRVLAFRSETGECEFTDCWDAFYYYYRPFLFRQLLDHLNFHLIDNFYFFSLERFQLRRLQELLVRRRRFGPVFLFWNWMTVHDRYHPYIPRDFSRKRSTFVRDYDFPREYTLAVRYADQRFRDVYELIKRCGELDRTIFIVTSDHGEFLGEYNLFGHHQTLFTPVLRVPLLVVHPALKGKRVSTPVSLAALRSLVESLVESKTPPDSEEIEETMVRREAVVAEQGDLPDEKRGQVQWSYTVIEGQHQYIYDPMIETYSSTWPANMPNFLFDLNVAPEERQNRYESEPELAERLREKYLKYLEKLPEGGGGVSEGTKQEIRDKMRSLGYL